MDLGMTQAELAQRLECTIHSVNAWENDRWTPAAMRWPDIEAVLGTGLVPSGEEFGKRLRTARLRLGLTQAQVAELAGLHVRTIRNLELGHRRPSARSLERLRAVFVAAQATSLP